MTTVSHNHVNYQARLDFVQTVLQERFGLKEIAEVTPIQYDPECPFKYNNFVYRVYFNAPITATNDGPEQPGCVPIPNDTKELIFRLANPGAEGMIQTTRIENEVATIALASTALVGFVPRVVPSVYGWGSAATKSSQGWILQELMPGASLDESFGAMDLEKKRGIFAQMGKILKALQDYELPASITGFGGVTFDGNGYIVSTAMTSVGAGPWPTYEASFKGRLEVALRKADESPYIEGWHANGVRERLDAFVDRGVPAQFEDLDSKQDRVIIHADFTANNILFDATSNRITALIDYDFACISHPSYEFLRSFDGVGGHFRGWSTNEACDAMSLRDAKLHGFPSPLPPTTKDGVKWEVVKAWEDKLEKLDVKRPRNMRGIDKVADIDTSEEAIFKCRNENETQLSGLLSRLGF
ncbi:hypothetical protein VE00_09325 [Pseudogymnoascus sp. WSF 3629]|nr:hypothetical protein VE00_09325 [Pseudogymnoascus sp. WSF 3629]